MKYTNKTKKSKSKVYKKKRLTKKRQTKKRLSKKVIKKTKRSTKGGGPFSFGRKPKQQYDDYIPNRANREKKLHKEILAIWVIEQIKENLKEMNESNIDSEITMLIDKRQQMPYSTLRGLKNYKPLNGNDLKDVEDEIKNGLQTELEAEPQVNNNNKNNYNYNLNN